MVELRTWVAFNKGYSDRKAGWLRPYYYPSTSTPRRAYMAGWGLADTGRKLGRIYP